MKTVYELARYGVGDTPYWIVLASDHHSDDLNDDDIWMTNYHPYILYKRGPYKNNWPWESELPRVAFYDFDCITEFLSSRLVVAKFNITDVIRSNNTGEFIYFNEHGEEMPERFLFDTKKEAIAEVKRITKLVRKWIKRNAGTIHPC